MKLSIVIPVYNTEAFVGKCLESCIDQNVSRKDYEIIVINDGSTDSSRAVVERYLKRYPNIRMHSQPNAGLSMARNAGLAMSEGEYVWFVDSDDTIAKNCLAKLFEVASGVDAVAFGSDLPQGVMSGSRFVVASDGKFQHGAPFYVFRRRFLLDNDLEFYIGIYHEDSEFTPRALCLSRSVAVIPDSLYNRYIREGSITQTVNVKRAYDLIFVIGRLESFIGAACQDKRLRRQMLGFLPLLANSSLNVVSESDPEQWKRYNRIFRDEHVVKHYFLSRDLRYMAEGLLLALSCNPVKTYKHLKRM